MCNAVDAFKVDAVQALCDSDTPADSSSKRLQKSVHRTLEFAKEAFKSAKVPTFFSLFEFITAIFFQIPIFGTVAGGYEAAFRIRCATEFEKFKFSGNVFVIILILFIYQVNSISTFRLYFRRVSSLQRFI